MQNMKVPLTFVVLLLLFLCVDYEGPSNISYFYVVVVVIFLLYAEHEGPSNLCYFIAVVVVVVTIISIVVCRASRSLQPLLFHCCCCCCY